MRNDVHHVAEAFDAHQRIDLYAPRHGDSPNIVAAEVNEHDVLRPLLLVREQFDRQPFVLFGRGPAPPRPGDGVVHDNAVFDPHQQFRRSADDLKFAHVEIEHVRRWVHHPQLAVDVERVDRRLPLQPMRRHDLDDVTGDHVLPDLIDHEFVAFAALVRFRHRTRPDHGAGLIHRDADGGVCQPLHDAVHQCARLHVRPLDIAIQAAVRDHLNNVVKVVEHEHRVAEQEHRFGYAHGIAQLPLDARFKVADRVVRHVANGAARERREVRHGHDLEARELPLERDQRVAFELGPWPGLEHAIRLRPDERIARQPFAALDRLEQERIRPLPHLQKRRNRRLHVRHHLAVDRHKVPLALRRNRLHFVQSRPQHHWPPRRLPSPAKSGEGLGVRAGTRAPEPAEPLPISEVRLPSPAKSGEGLGVRAAPRNLER